MSGFFYLTLEKLFVSMCGPGVIDLYFSLRSYAWF